MSPGDPVEAWLLGEGPEPDEAALDQLVEAALPSGLAAATLGAIARERRRAGPRSWWAGAATAAALAAAALLSLEPAALVGDPAQLVRKGDGGAVAPAVALKMAVKRGARPVERLRRDTTYAPGDIFFFRYSVAGPGELHLLRAAHGRVAVLHSRHVEGGEADLSADISRGSRPLAWTAGPADGHAVFALVTSPRPPESLAAELERTLAEGVDAEAFCAAAGALGARCDARDVEVMP